MCSSLQGVDPIQKLMICGSLSVELMPPNKTDVLPFLTNNCNTVVRYAQAILMFGATEEPYIREYKIGPLPLTSNSTVQPYTFRSNRGGDGRVGVFNPDTDAYVAFDKRTMADAEDVTKFLWNLVSKRTLEVCRNSVLII